LIVWKKTAVDKYKSMTPGSRIQAAIELLSEIFTSWQSEKRFPADKHLERYFKSHRYIGSKDRAAVGELVYWVLRYKASLEWWLERLKGDVHARSMVLTALMLRKDFSPAELAAMTQDSQYALPRLSPPEATRCEQLYKETSIEHPDMPPHVRLNYPLWVHDILREGFGEDLEKAMRAMNEQASTDLRVNTLKTTREALLSGLEGEGFEGTPTPVSPIGIRLSKRAPIFTSKYFKEGHFEVQDEGSQIVSQLVAAEPGMKVIDFCAGAGGKTLAIAAQMKNKGRILAWDISEKRLSQIKLRLRRASVDTVQTHVIENENDQFIKRHKTSADRVLVDAPCSGSGTWRRNPDLKWRFSARDLQEVLGVQQSILQSASRLVKPGGRLIYVTCSVFKDENEHQIETLLKNINNFGVVSPKKIWDNPSFQGKKSENSYLWLAPHQDGVDGFFVAVLERIQ
jgi:16S rRNA (cytosine967-C5)-methyltransferase